MTDNRLHHFKLARRLDHRREPLDLLSRALLYLSLKHYYSQEIHTMMNAQEIKSHLSQFNGCEQPYCRHTGFIKIEYTDGIRFLQDKVGCFWLTDMIASYQTSDFKAKHDRQFWKLTVSSDRSGVLICDDGNGEILASQTIPHTDFPLPEIRIWVYIMPHVFLLLPSEY